MKIKWRKCIYIYFLMLFLCIFFKSCKSPEAPEAPEAPEPIVGHQYRKKVKVIYTRDSSLITAPEYQYYAELCWELYDPVLSGEMYPYRSDCVDMERIAKNKFRAYLKHVWVQERPSSRDHKVLVYDYSINPLWPPPTGTGIEVSGAYDVRIWNWGLGTALFFKMSKK